MKGKSVGKAAYILLVICLAFAMGFVLGIGKGETHLTIQTVAEEQTQEEQPAEETEPVSHQRVNINTATLEELQELPGIGPTLAQRILDSRKEYGFFPTVAQLKDVEGIGSKRYAELEPLITVGGFDKR